MVEHKLEHTKYQKNKMKPVRLVILLLDMLKKEHVMNRHAQLIAKVLGVNGLPVLEIVEQVNKLKHTQ